MQWGPDADESIGRAGPWAASHPAHPNPAVDPVAGDCRCRRRTARKKGASTRVTGCSSSCANSRFVWYNRPHAKKHVRTGTPEQHREPTGQLKNTGRTVKRTTASADQPAGAGGSQPDNSSFRAPTGIRRPGPGGSRPTCYQIGCSAEMDIAICPLIGFYRDRETHLRLDVTGFVVGRSFYCSVG